MEGKEGGNGKERGGEEGGRCPPNADSCIDVKNVFLRFLFWSRFLRFLTFFYFFPRFLFSSNVVKEARRGRIFKFHGLTKAYAQLQHLLAIRRSEWHDD